MRHILMFAMILGLTLGFAPHSYAGKDEPTPPDAGETLEGGDGKGGGEEEVCDPKKENCDGEEEVVCDPKKENCDDDGKGGGEVSGGWHNYKPGSKELEQAKAEIQNRRDIASQEVKDWHESKRLERKAVVGKK
jgi:hypothetical protein